MPPNPLKPCGHCGAIPELVMLNAKEETGYLFCKCGIETKIGTVPELIELWNRRA